MTLAGLMSSHPPPRRAVCLWTPCPRKNNTAAVLPMSMEYSSLRNPYTLGAVIGVWSEEYSMDTHSVELLPSHAQRGCSPGGCTWPSHWPSLAPAAHWPSQASKAVHLESVDVRLAPPPATVLMCVCAGGMGGGSPPGPPLSLWVGLVGGSLTLL